MFFNFDQIHLLQAVFTMYTRGVSIPEQGLLESKINKKYIMRWWEVYLNNQLACTHKDLHIICNNIYVNLDIKN